VSDRSAKDRAVVWVLGIALVGLAIFSLMLWREL